MSKNHFILSKVTNFINAIAICLLLLCYAAPYIDPLDFWPIAFMGLSYKFWLIVNLFLLAFWISRRKKRLVYNLIAIVLGYGFLFRNIQFNSESTEVEKAFSVVSFNTNVQHVYAGGNTSQEIEDYLIELDADVVLLVEWLNKKGRISKELYPHQQFILLKAKRNGHEYGLTLVSKHKIIDYDRIIYGHYSNNMSAYYDIDINGEIVRFIGCHLQGNGISSRDYQEFKSLDFSEEKQQRAKSIIKRLTSSFEKRSVQVKQIQDVIDASPYPVIVMGDFNDTPQSYTYTQLRGSRKDAFIERGRGWGATYLKPFPLLRIDYMFYDERFKCNRFNMSKKIKSDHKLLYAEFDF